MPSRISSFMLFALAFATAPVVAEDMPGLIAHCGDGPVKGTRIQYSDETGQPVEIIPEQIKLEPLTYVFDIPEAGSVRVTYGGEDINATVVNTTENYKTVTYVYNDVAYLDTLYFNTGTVFSSEHTDGLFGENVVITWHIACEIQR